MPDMHAIQVEMWIITFYPDVGQLVSMPVLFVGFTPETNPIGLALASFKQSQAMINRGDGHFSTVFCGQITLQSPVITQVRGYEKHGYVFVNPECKGLEVI